MSIESYLEHNSSRWSESTLKSEASRLKKILPVYDRFPEDPYAFYVEFSRSYKPYTLQTIIVRLCNYLKFLNIENSPYFSFISDYANLFKNAYVTEELEISFEEAKARIKSIADANVRSHCLGLLYTGLRISESFEVRDNEVVGKGGKRRSVLGRVELLRPLEVTKAQVYKELRTVGLKPHSLRKLFATELAKKDLTEADLCKILGWSDYKTAKRYLQPMKNAEISQLIHNL